MADSLLAVKDMTFNVSSAAAKGYCSRHSTLKYSLIHVKSMTQKLGILTSVRADWLENYEFAELGITLFATA